MKIVLFLASVLLTHILHFQISSIKRSTDAKILYETLVNFVPKPAKYETITDLFRNIEKEQRKTQSEEVKSSGGVFQTALQLHKNNQPSVADFFKKVEEMGEKKNNRDLKTLFGDESDDEGTRKKVEDVEKKEKKRKHEERHRKGEKKQKLGESSIDKEYEKFVESVEGTNRNKKNKLKKTEIGNLVVKLLTPAYVERRFESRDTFKSTARNISHALIDKGNVRGEIFLTKVG